MTVYAASDERHVPPATSPAELGNIESIFNSHVHFLFSYIQ